MASCVVIVLDVDGVGVDGSGLSFYPVGHPHVYVGAALAGTRRLTLDFFLVESGVVEWLYGVVKSKVDERRSHLSQIVQVLLLHGGGKINEN